MSKTFCVIRNAQFKSTAKRLDIHEDALELICHKYINEHNGEFPSDEYITSQYTYNNVVTSDIYNDLLTIWEEEYSSPTTVDTFEKALDIKEGALDYFNEKAIIIKPLHDGKYEVRVAKPRKLAISSIGSDSMQYQINDTETDTINSRDDYNQQIEILKNTEIYPSDKKWEIEKRLRKLGIDAGIIEIIANYKENNLEKEPYALKAYDIYQMAMDLKTDSIAKEYRQKFKQSVDETLENHLRKFLEKYFFKVKEEENLADLLGVDSITGATDLLRKIIYLGKDRNAITFAEEFAHAYLELLGAVEKSKKNSSYADVADYNKLAEAVTNTTIFQQVYDEYKDVYLNKYGKPDIAKIKKEAIGQALANAIVNNWQSIHSDEKKEQSKKDKGLLAFLKDLWDKFISWLSSNQRTMTEEFEDMLNTMAQEIINNDTTRLQKIKDTANWQRLGYSETMERQQAIDRGLARGLMEDLVHNFNAAITGSLSYRLQGPVRRRQVDSLHDIDVHIPASAHGVNVQNLSHKKREEVYAIASHSMFVKKLTDLWGKDNLQMVAAYPDLADDEITISMAFSHDPAISKKFANLKGTYEKRMQQMTEEERKKLYVFDFFLRGTDDIERVNRDGLSFTSWQTSFRKKLAMGRAKDIFDYQNWNPFEDYADENLPGDVNSAEEALSLYLERESGSIIPEVKREMEAIKEQAIKDGTFMKAPNGNSTNLNEEQWLLVRTKNFKEWFGDWENDPENASKVVDENGEPLVVYHGTDSNFTEFKSNNPLGTFFSPSRSYAESKGKNIYEVFLNIRDLYNTREGNFNHLKQADGTIDPNHTNNYTVNSPNQIKSATDNNGEFSTTNDNIMFQRAPIVYNEEQKNAIEAAVQHIKDVKSGKASTPFFTIQGKAGTGKTTIVNEIIKQASAGNRFSRPTVIIGALSHKATEVLRSKMPNELSSLVNITSKTIAGMLNKKRNNDGSFSVSKEDLAKAPIRFANIVFIDEASMVTEEDLRDIIAVTKGRNIPIIFLGDRGQLPPVRSGSYYREHKIDSETLSPVFSNDDIPHADLQTRVRQGEESPVLDYGDKYWNYSQEVTDEYPNDIEETSKVTDKGALIVQRSEIDLVQQLLPLFREAMETKNPNLVKIVAYTTNTKWGKESAVDRYNRLIREALHPNEDLEGFFPGDLIIFNDSYGDENGRVPNSLEASVLSVQECESSLPEIEGVELEEVDRQYITFKLDNGTIRVPALVPTKENIARHKSNLNALANLAKRNKRMWGVFWHYHDTYAANIGYAYAISAHKSQGSTYDIVAVDAADINSVRGGSEKGNQVTLKQKAQAVYTALTRASNITIISSNTTNEDKIYTDIKSINDRINSVKEGTADGEFTPEFEEGFFPPVTEEDIPSLIIDPTKSKKGRRRTVDDTWDDDGVNVSAAVEDAELPDVTDADLKDDETWGDDSSTSTKKNSKPESKPVPRRVEVPAPRRRADESNLSPQEKAHKAFIVRQRQIGLAIKFFKKGHKYTIDGNPIDMSVTEFRDFLLGEKHEDSVFLEVAGRIGDTHDTIFRDFFEDNVQNSYPNVNKVQLKQVVGEARRLKSKLEKRYTKTIKGKEVKPIFITDPELLRVGGTINYDGKNYKVAGTMDMVVIDGEGNIHIVDFKTKRSDSSAELSIAQQEKYSLQVSLYKALSADKTLQDYLDETLIAQFNVKYASPNSVEYRFNGDQIQIKGKSGLIDIQSTGRYQAGELYRTYKFDTNLEKEDITCTPLKTKLQDSVESKKVDRETTTEPKQMSGRMVKYFNGEKRDGIKAASTFGAILEGKRHATTRKESEGHFNYWKSAKAGDIITFKDTTGKTVRVVVTKDARVLTRDEDPEVWSRKEGWSVEYFKREILPEIKKGNKCIQIEFELLRENNDEEGATSRRIEINSRSKNKRFIRLSNFGDKPFTTIDSIGKEHEFPTVEHYFHWAKAIHVGDYTMAGAIENAKSPEQAYVLGKKKLKMTKEQQKSWDKKSRNIMKKGMREAFEQNPDAKKLLLSTGNALLTHFYNEETGESKGPFADILMELREEFGGYGKPTTVAKAEEEAKKKYAESKKAPKAANKNNEAEEATTKSLKNKEDFKNIKSNFIESKGSYGQRTDENAEWADVTMALAQDFTSPGEIRTARAAGAKVDKDKKVTDKGDRYVSSTINSEVSLNGLAEDIATDIYDQLDNIGKKKSIKLNIAGNTIQTLSKDYTQEQLNDLLYKVLEKLLANNVTISEIRSGGQTGIDEAGIIAARKLGIPWSVNAPKGWKFRDANGNDIEDKEQFISRFTLDAEQVNTGKWVSRGEKKFKINSVGYKKGDPQENEDTAFVYTENAQAAAIVYEGSEEQDRLTEEYGDLGNAELVVSDVNGTNQAGIRTKSGAKKKQNNPDDLSKNAFGIVVKLRQQDKEGAWLKESGQFPDTDEYFNMFMDYNNRFFDELDNSGLKKIVFPVKIAMGKAALPERFAVWLSNELYARYGILTRIDDNKTEGYQGKGLTVLGIEEDKVDSSLHVEKISGKYTPINSSSVEELNAKAVQLREQGWHVEFYKKKSDDGSIVNETMTISIDGNPKKGFFELVKDAEDDNYSVHFKTKSSKANNVSDFAEEALEDTEKENLFKALIFAIPEGGIVSTWGKLTKGGLAALDSLAERSNGSLSKIGDKVLTNGTDDISVPVYKKLSEKEMIKENINRVRRATAAEKREVVLPKYENNYFVLSLAKQDKDSMYNGAYELSLDETFEDVDVTTGSYDNKLASLTTYMHYSSLLTLNTEIINTNFLYALNKLLSTRNLFPYYADTVISIDPRSKEGKLAGQYADNNPNFRYDRSTGELRIPMFTVGYTMSQIRKRKQYNTLINNDIIKEEELRKLSKATMYKVSEYITKLQTYANYYKRLFGKDPQKDYTSMSRIEIIKDIGLNTLLDKVKERVFDSEIAPADLSESTIDKMNLIYDNWEAFVTFGYDTLIGLEEIAMSEKADYNTDIKNGLDDLTEDADESEIMERFGSSIEHWQVGFRQISAYNSLSNLIKRVLDSMYKVDSEGNIIEDEFGIGEHLDVQEAVSKILYYTQGAQSLDETVNGEYTSSSMIKMLKDRVSAEPWLQQVINLLEDQYNEEGELVKAADEQFKTQFYNNFQKYFQKYAITYKDKSGKVLIKVINENEYSDILVKAAQAKENQAATGKFKLKTKEGKVNQETLKDLREVAKRISKYGDTVIGTKGAIKDLINLDDYHEDLKELFDLLDLDTPSDENLFSIFGVKKNLKSLIQHLDKLVDSIEERVSQGKSITGDRDYIQIAAIVAKEMGLELESVSYEAGKLYYSYVNPSYLGRLVTKLKATNMSEKEYKDFMENEYLRYPEFSKDGKIRGRWLTLLNKKGTTGQKFRDALQHVTSLHYLGTEYTEKTPAEYIASVIKMYFYDTNKNWAYYRIPILSNKPSEEYVKFERISQDYENIILDELLTVFAQEIDRIAAVRERAKDIDKDQEIVSKGKKKSFEHRGLKFVFEDYLQKYVDGTYKQRPEYKNLKTEEKAREDKFSELLNAKLDGKIDNEGEDYANLMILFKEISKRGIDEKFERAKKQWVSEGFMTLKEDGSINKIVDNMKLSNESLREFYWNDFFASINIMQLTITDPAYYTDTEDLQKRIAQLHAPGIQPNILAKDSKGNPYTKDGKERTIYVKDDEIKSGIMANLRKSIEQIIARTPANRRVAVARQLRSIEKAFAKVNVADAQGYSCPTSYRKKLGIFGQWDERMETAYEKLTHPEKYPDISLSDLLDVLWQPLKPFVYTQIPKPGHNDVMPILKVGVQNKNSEFVLMMVDALLQHTGKPNKLRAIYEFMEESQRDAGGNPNGEGIDTVQFMSAVNVGCCGVIDLNDERDSNGIITHYKTEDEVKAALSKAYSVREDGTIDYSPTYVHEIPFTDYIIQQNIPAHFREHRQQHGSQDRILTFADMLDKDPVTGEDNYLVIKDANGIGRRVTVAKAKEDYFNAIADNIDESRRELIERLHINASDPRETNVAISAVLKEAILADSRYGADLYWACDTNENGEFNIPLSDPIQSNRIQQLLNSVIKNTINKQEIEGGPVVQVSNWGTSRRLNIRYKTKDGLLLLSQQEFHERSYPSEYSRNEDQWKTPDEYWMSGKTYEDYIEDQAGVAYFEAFAPMPSRSFIKDFTKIDENGNEYIDMEEVEKNNPELLDMIGYRIPTESKYSMAPIKVVGFIPMTEGVMLPAEITTLAGSDFDIDKLYMMRYQFRRELIDGKPKYIKVDEGRAGRDNLIVATQLAVLQSQQVEQQLFTPGNFDEPKRLGYLISYVQRKSIEEGLDPRELYEEAENWDIDKLKEENVNDYNLCFFDVQVQFHKQNMTAGKLIGIFAQANVSHAFISLVDNTTLIIPEEDSFTLDNVEINGEVEIDSILTRDKSINISNNLASLLAASVDAVKDPVLNLMNINNDTANLVTSLLRMGFSMETVALLCSQPVIKDLIRDFKMRKAQDKSANIYDVVESIIEKMSSDVRAIKDINVTTDNLIDNLDGSDDYTNYKVLQIFLRMHSIADAFGDITHMTRYNSITSAVGPFASDTMIQRIKRDAAEKNKMISAEVKKAWDNPILKAFRENSFALEASILGSRLIQAGHTYERAIRALGEALGFDRGISAKIATPFTDFFMAYYINDNNNPVFDLSYENRKKVLTEFPKEFNTIKEDYSDNILINSILYVETDREQYPFLRLKTRGVPYGTIEDFKNAWTTLFENPETTGLAIRLVEYNFFRGTLGFNPKTFMSLVPNIIRSSGLNNYTTILNKRDSNCETDPNKIDNIVNQFILHNPWLIKNRYDDFDSFNPESSLDRENGTIYIVNRTSENNVRLEHVGPFIIIDDNIYYVVEDKEGSSTMILAPVEELGGNKQGIEISTTEKFPKSVYDPNFKATHEHGKSGESGGRVETKSEKEIAQIIDTLFDEDEDLQELLTLSPNDALKSINAKLKDSGEPGIKGNATQIRKLFNRLGLKEKTIEQARETLKDFC